MKSEAGWLGEDRCLRKFENAVGSILDAERTSCPLGKRELVGMHGEVSKSTGGSHLSGLCLSLSRPVTYGDIKRTLK